MKLLHLILAVFGLLLAGCGDTIKGKAIAEPEVTLFRDKMKSGEYEEIYDQASKDFQAAVSKEKVVALFAAIERKLGPLVDSKLINWNVRTINTTTNTVLVYASRYSSGEATETFTYRISSGKAQLVGYNISSLDMLIK